MQRSGYKRQRNNQYDYPDRPQPKRRVMVPANPPGSYLARTSQFPMYKYVSPIAKKLTPGPNVKKTEYHAVIVYPQVYPATPLFGGPAPEVPDVPAQTIKGSLYPQALENMRAQCLTICGQGNSSTQRSGNAVDAKGIQLYVQIYPPNLCRLNIENNRIDYSGNWRPTGEDNGSTLAYNVNSLQSLAGQCRIIVLLDKDFTGGKPPTVSDIFADGCTSATVPGLNYNDSYNSTCQLKPDATQRYLVLMNKIVQNSPMGGIKTIKKNIKLDGVEIRYVQSDGTAAVTNCAQNTVWLFVLADQAYLQPSDPNEGLQDSLPTWTFTSRFRFMPK